MIELKAEEPGAFDEASALSTNAGLPFWCLPSVRRNALTDWNVSCSVTLVIRLSAAELQGRKTRKPTLRLRFAGSFPLR